jgi:hypothetical protein
MYEISYALTKYQSWNVTIDSRGSTLYKVIVMDGLDASFMHPNKWELIQSYGVFASVHQINE